MKRVNYYMAEDQVEMLAQIAKEDRTSVSQIIREALDMYIKERNKKI